MEREITGYREAIYNFCDAWDEGLGGDSAYVERLRRALANRGSQTQPPSTNQL
jgi:hypothetical protein